MPLFKVTLEDEGCAIKLMSCQTLQEVIENAKSKFALPEGKYKVIVRDENVEIDDDDILIAYAEEKLTQKLPPMTLCVIPEGLNLNRTRETNKQNAVSGGDQEKSNSQSATEMQGDLRMNILWTKIPQRIMAFFINKKPLSPPDKHAVTRIIAEHMIEELNDKKYGTASKIAAIMCQSYPETFIEKIGEQIIGNGFECLRTSIYNCIQYKSTVAKTKRVALSDDSDDEDQRERSKEKQRKINQDEYGCVNFAPLLPDSESESSQESKRLQLLGDYTKSQQNKEEISALMKITFPTQRQVLNKVNRDLHKVFSDWPYLQDCFFLIEHASQLLDSDVSKTWNESCNSKAKTIRRFFTVPDNRKGNNDMSDMIRKAKDACIINENKIPKIVLIFPLLMSYFKNRMDFMIVSLPRRQDDDIIEKELIKLAHPILVIRGEDIYDSNAICNVVLERTISIPCQNILQGILVTFLCYYVFGYNYPEEIHSTLEFIQRLFLKINPTSGSKKEKQGKRKSKSFDSGVFKLARKLEVFSNDFIIT